MRWRSQVHIENTKKKKKSKHKSSHGDGHAKHKSKHKKRKHDSDKEIVKSNNEDIAYIDDGPRTKQMKLDENSLQVNIWKSFFLIIS